MVRHVGVRSRLAHPVCLLLLFRCDRLYRLVGFVCLMAILVHITYNVVYVQLASLRADWLQFPLVVFVGSLYFVCAYNCWHCSLLRVHTYTYLFTEWCIRLCVGLDLDIDILICVIVYLHA